MQSQAPTTAIPRLKLSPSILTADFGRLAEQIQEAEAAGADYIHLDIMDGRFVPNITFGPLIVAAVRKVTTLPLDVHLMIADPDRFVPAFAEAGATILTVHQEACIHLQRQIAQIKEAGVKAGVALNPATSLSAIEDVVQDLDLLLIMSVNPGFGGQKFLPHSLDKLRRARALLDARGSAAELEVDGGVHTENIAAVTEAGTCVFVTGSAVFNRNQSVAQAISALRGGMERARV